MITNYYLMEGQLNYFIIEITRDVDFCEDIVSALYVVVCNSEENGVSSLTFFGRIDDVMFFFAIYCFPYIHGL